MKTIVVDSVLRDQLLAAGDVAEVQDATGRLLGRFVSASPAVYVVEGDMPPEAELDRRSRDSRRFTADEVIARLRSIRGNP